MIDKTLGAIVIIAGVFLIAEAAAAPRGKIDIPIRIAYVDSRDNIGVPAVEKLVDVSAALLSRLSGLKFYREKTFWFSDIYPNDALDVASRAKQLNLYVNGFRKTIALKDGVLLVVTGPLHANGIQYMAGIANGTCRVGSKDAIAIVNVRHTSAFDVFGWIGSVTSIMHEIGHLMGGFHDDGSCKLMNSSAGFCAKTKGKTPWFSSLSTAQIRQCVARELR